MAQILLIDDDTTTRQVLRKFLESAGHSVIEAANGKEGMTAFTQSRPELVITDIIMPEQEGLETIKLMKKQQPEIKIIAMTGGGTGGFDEYLRMALTFGAREVLAKPLQMRSFVSTVQHMLT